jgi:hypothetical protein
MICDDKTEEESHVAQALAFQDYRRMMSWAAIASLKLLLSHLHDIAVFLWHDPRFQQACNQHQAPKVTWAIQDRHLAQLHDDRQAICTWQAKMCCIT